MGGDWVDVIWLSGARVASLVGDVLVGDVVDIQPPARLSGLSNPYREWLISLAVNPGVWPWSTAYGGSSYVSLKRSLRWFTTRGQAMAAGLSGCSGAPVPVIDVAVGDRPPAGGPEAGVRAADRAADRVEVRPVVRPAVTVSGFRETIG